MMNLQEEVALSQYRPKREAVDTLKSVFSDRNTLLFLQHYSVHIVNLGANHSYQGYLLHQGGHLDVFTLDFN